MVISRGRTPPSLRIVHLLTNAAGKARRIRWHDQGRPVSGLPRSRPTTASQETCHSCRARSPTLGKRPAASTEVVLAERMNSARPGAARWGDFLFSPAGRRWPEGSDEGGAPHTLNYCPPLALRAFASFVAHPLIRLPAPTRVEPRVSTRPSDPRWGEETRGAAAPHLSSESLRDGFGSNAWPGRSDERRRYALPYRRSASA
jgi:hypothetical protein